VVVSSGALYRLGADAVATAVSAVPILERPLRWLGAVVWEWPGAGRFYRSVAGRYMDHLRASGSPFRSVTVGDTRLIVDVTEFTTSNLYFGKRFYEPATTACLRRHLAPGRVFVDIGANHGYFTLLAAALVGPRGRVVAFEPNPPVFAQLTEHVRLNGFTDRTSLVQQAVTDKPDDRATLFVSRWSGNSGVSTLVPDAPRVAVGAVSPDHTVAVRTETFDRWFERSGFDRVDLVKIDTEGCEDLVVAGMAAALGSGRVGAVICETHPETRAHRVLCAAGYMPQPLDVSGPLTNFVYARAE
jgi:FkbM family methyltransferase